MLDVIGKVLRWSRRSVDTIVDRLVASDPGMTRLFFALRPVSSVVIVVVLLLLVARFPLPVVIVGGLLSLNVATSLRDPEWSKLLLGAGGAMVFAAASLAVSSALSTNRVAADVVFLVVIFLAVYLRRFAGWGMPAGFAGFMSFFVAQFTHIGPRLLPLAIVCAAVGIGCGLIVVVLMMRFVRRHAVDRMLSALRVRVARLVDAVDAALSSGNLDGRRGERLERESERLHAAALMIEGELERSTDLTVDPELADRIRGRIVAAELAGERLVVVARWGLSEGLAQHQRLRAVAELDQLRQYLRRDPGAALAADQKRLLAGIRAAAADREAGEAQARGRRAIRELVLAVVLLRREWLAAYGTPRPASPRPDESGAETPATTSRLTEPRAQPGTEPARRPARLLDRLQLTTRQAVQAAVAGAIAIGVGELVSAQRWYWAVITAFVVFAGTTSRGDLLVKGFRRALGTVLGVVIGIAVAIPVAGNVPVAVVLILLSVFFAFYFLNIAYSVMSFFITVMVSLLYDLIGIFSPGVLVLRVEETAIGVVAGSIAAVFVLPTKTGEAVSRDVLGVLDALRTFLGRTVDTLVDGEAVNLIEESRGIDKALETLTATTTPLLHRISPFRGRRNAFGYLMTLLELCAYRARTLAANAETAALADHRDFRENALRAQINLDRLSEAVEAALHSRQQQRRRLAPGAGLAQEDEQPASSVGRRLLVYFDRLDDAIVALARPVDTLWGRPWAERGSDAVGPAGTTVDPPTIPLRPVEGTA